MGASFSVWRGDPFKPRGGVVGGVGALFMEMGGGRELLPDDDMQHECSQNSFVHIRSGALPLDDLRSEGSQN